MPDLVLLSTGPRGHSSPSPVTRCSPINLAQAAANGAPPEAPRTPKRCICRWSESCWRAKAQLDRLWCGVNGVPPNPGLSTAMRRMHRRCAASCSMLPPMREPGLCRKQGISAKRQAGDKCVGASLCDCCTGRRHILYVRGEVQCSRCALLRIQSVF
jgi:hypothetical protein